MNNSSLKESWVQFIDRDNWELFITITFKENTSYFSKNENFTAIQKFKYFFKHLNSYYNEFYDKFILGFIVFEPFPSGTGVHIHALVKGIPPSKAELLQEKLTTSLGLSVVTIYDPTKGAKFYLAQKISRNKLEDYGKYVINSAIRKEPKPLIYGLIAPESVVNNN